MDMIFLQEETKPHEQDNYIFWKELQIWNFLICFNQDSHVIDDLNKFQDTLTSIAAPIDYLHVDLKKTCRNWSKRQRIRVKETYDLIGLVIKIRDIAKIMKKCVSVVSKD